MIFFIDLKIYNTSIFLPSFYYDCYLILLFFILILFVVAFVILMIVTIFNNRFWNISQMQSIYECGFLPFEEARVRFEPKFYMVALSFIIFDLEICFVFPWLLVFQFLHVYFFVLFFIFLLLILFGIVYEWKNGIFDWNP